VGLLNPRVCALLGRQDAHNLAPLGHQAFQPDDAVSHRAGIERQVGLGEAGLLDGLAGLRGRGGVGQADGGAEGCEVVVRGRADEGDEGG
jgi:hypothetical protein